MGSLRTLDQSIRLILDFDGTLTKRDTMHLVAGAGYARQLELKRDPQPSPWNEVVNAYLSDYERHRELYTSQLESRTSLDDEIIWLDSLAPVERASITRALRAGIFDHVRSYDMSQAVKLAFKREHLQMRSGWLSLLSAVRIHNTTIRTSQNNNTQSALLSVNWSRAFIRHTLFEAAGPEISDSETSSWLSGLSIYANELPSIFAELGHADEPLVERYQDIRTSGDKARVLRDLIKRDTNVLTIYVGDSLTDLGCLVAANVGICVRDDPLGSGQEELAAACERTNVPVEPIGTANVSTALGDQSPPRLFWAHNFLEIQHWLFSSEVKA